jgi:hypothetical protein
MFSKTPLPLWERGWGEGGLSFVSQSGISLPSECNTIDLPSCHPNLQINCGLAKIRDSQAKEIPSRR